MLVDGVRWRGMRGRDEAGDGGMRDGEGEGGMKLEMEA